MIDRDQLAEGAQAMADQMGEMGGSIVKQRAINYVQQEYEAQGISLTDVQNSYLAGMSAKMFGLCAISLVATILTGAVASHTACTIARDLRRKTFDQVMHFSPAEVGKFSQASLITRCTNDIQQIQMATTLFIRMVLICRRAPPASSATMPRHTRRPSASKPSRMSVMQVFSSTVAFGSSRTQASRCVVISSPVMSRRGRSLRRTRSERAAAR